MSHDIPSRARAIIAFLGVETGYGARIKALAARLSVWEESVRETKHAGLAFTSLLSG